jgi:hypothetical protein
MNETLLKEQAAASERGPWMWFHWQNLNDKRDGTQGSGLRHGRCWWHFRATGKRPGPDIEFCWNFLTHFLGVSVDLSDEDLTFHISFLLAAFWISFSTEFSLIRALAPRRVLSPNYPNTIVIDEGAFQIAVHGGRLWFKVWGPTDWTRSDPWWRRGVSVSINPFEWVHMRHEVRCADGSWQPYVGSWGRDKQPDTRQTCEYPYRYILKNGEIQDRTATVFVDRMAWRPKCLKWTSLFEKERQTIDVQFNDEVGEKSGSWKGGCIGCSYEMLPGESPEQTLRRMEAERKF